MDEKDVLFYDVEIEKALIRAEFNAELYKQVAVLLKTLKLAGVPRPIRVQQPGVCTSTLWLKAHRNFSISWCNEWYWFDTDNPLTQANLSECISRAKAFLKD